MPNQETASHAFNALAEAVRRRLPAHVTNRVAALAGDDEIEWTTGGMTSVDSGWVAAFTSERVVRADFVESPHDFDPRMPEAGDDATATVTVHAWPRKDLRWLTIPAEPGRNSDHRWNGMWRSVWPIGSAVDLNYGERGTIRVTFPEQREFDPEPSEKFLAFVESLMRDLP